MLTLCLPRYVVDQFKTRCAAARTIVIATAHGDRVTVQKPSATNPWDREVQIKKVTCQTSVKPEVEIAFRERAKSLGTGLTELAMRTICYEGEAPSPVHRWNDIPEDRSMLLSKDDYDSPTYEECIEILKRKGMA